MSGYSHLTAEERDRIAGLKKPVPPFPEAAHRNGPPHSPAIRTSTARVISSRWPAALPTRPRPARRTEAISRVARTSGRPGDHRIQMADRGVSGQERDDDDRRIGQKRIALDDDQGDVAMRRDVEAAQSFHVPPPGPARMSASG